MADNGLWRELVQNVSNGVKALNNLAVTLGKVFPAWSGSTSTTATAGAAVLPANPVGFIEIVNPTTGDTVKIPYYGQ
jgi:hypothetical protein